MVIFRVGQQLTHNSGIRGTFIKEYYATGVGMQLHIKTPDGKVFYGPKSEFK